MAEKMLLGEALTDTQIDQLRGLDGTTWTRENILAIVQSDDSKWKGKFQAEELAEKVEGLGLEFLH